MKSLSTVLYSELMMCCVGSAFFTMDHVIGGNWREATKMFMHRFEPRTALAKRAHLGAIITNPPARKIEEMETAIF